MRSRLRERKHGDNGRCPGVGVTNVMCQMITGYNQKKHNNLSAHIKHDSFICAHWYISKSICSSKSITIFEYITSKTTRRTCLIHCFCLERLLLQEANNQYSNQLKEKVYLLKTLYTIYRWKIKYFPKRQWLFNTSFLDTCPRSS